METILREVEAKLKDITSRLQADLQAVRSNRPSVGLLEEVKVEYYGQEMPVKALGSLSIRPPRDIEVSVWDKGAITAVAKAIETAKMGFSVSVDGSTVRVTLPPLTDERRAELSKLVKRMSEDSRIEVRGSRDEANKRLRAEEDAGASEDQVFKTKEQIQKAVDSANERIETLLAAKLKELVE